MPRNFKLLSERLPKSKYGSRKVSSKPTERRVIRDGSQDTFLETRAAKINQKSD